MLANSLAGLPAFLSYFVSGAVLMAVFAWTYLRATPHPELKLISGGNTAAAVGLIGAMLGFSLPLASAIAHSVSFVDMLVWAGVGLVVQLLVVVTARLTAPKLFLEIEAGTLAPAILLAGISVTVGMINAASMSY